MSRFHAFMRQSEIKIKKIRQLQDLGNINANMNTYKCVYKQIKQIIFCSKPLNSV